MTTMKWFRLYSEILHDRKIARIAKRENIQKTYLLGIWVSILCIANDSQERGALMIGDNMPMTPDEIADELEIDLLEFMPIWSALVDVDMIEDRGDCFYISNWDKRQFKSDSSVERVKRYRKNKANNDVTLQKRYSNALDTDTDTDTEPELPASHVDVTNRDNDGSGSVFLFYENNIAPLTDYVSQQIGAAIDEFGADDVIEAMGIAATANKRQWNYINGILRKWRTEGKQIAPSSNGANKSERKAELMAIIQRYGRKRYKEALPELQAAGMDGTVKLMGGWTSVCNMQEKDFSFKFYEAVK